MKDKEDLIAELSTKALSAIKFAYGTAEDEYGATLFVAHHLEVIDASYWQTLFKVDIPEASQVLDCLVLSPYCVDEEDEEDEEIGSLDFTLPDEVTNYLLCVSFDDGVVSEISMES